MRFACDSRKFSPVFVITTLTRFHDGLAGAFMYIKLVPIELNLLPSAPLTDIVCDLSTFIFIFCAIDNGARLMEAPVSHMILTLIGSGTLFLVVGFWGGY